MFEVKSATFTDIPQANPSVTIATSANRAFINAIRIYRASNTATGIDAVSETAAPVMYNLRGQRVNFDYKGIVIMNGKKVVLK